MLHHRSVALAGVLILSLTSLVPVQAGATTQTFFLHASTAQNADEIADSNGVPTGTGPTMDANPPTLPAPKVVQTSDGNEAYYKNFLLAYWTGHLHGLMGNVTADLWITAPTGGQISVSLLADGGSVPLANAKKIVSLGAQPSDVRISFGAQQVDVNGEVVLQVFAGAVGDEIYVDGTTTPSSLTFSLGPYVEPAKVSFTPASGWNAPVQISSTLAQRETSIAVDPTNDANMFLCDPSGVPNTQYGQSWFFRTADKGTTWNYTRVETSPTDLREYTFEGGDCDVAYDAAGTMYTADTWAGDLSVGHSFDKGLTWNGTPLAVTSPVVDRPWLVGGPAGTIHVTYQDLQTAMPTAIWYTRSTDSGSTFLPAVPVVVSDPNRPFSWEGNFVVSPDQQNLYLVYTTRTAQGEVNVETQGLSGVGPENVLVAASHDGGLTWASTLVASMPAAASFLYPSIAMDAGGYLHVVFSSATSKDQPIWYSFSKDGGLHWTNATPILDGVGAYSPWIVGGAAGQAAFTFLGSTTPTNAPSTNADWYFYAGRVTGADSGTPSFTVGPTTTVPMFHGKQSETPEFEQLRLDAGGKIQLGMSVYFQSSGWAEYYQGEQ